jgi:DNA end-binding protein Ku
VADDEDEVELEPGASRRGALWSGTLSFGLVSIPVELYPAIRASRSPLRLLDGDGTPLRRHFFCPKDEREIADDELVRGIEVREGRVVTVSDEELERLEPKKSREIDLRLFVARTELDPVYFERAYFLAAAKEANKAYRLLCAVMEKSDRAGIATFVMRDREYLVAIFAESGVLCAQTLRFADEIRAARGLAPARARAAPAAVQRTERAIAAHEKKAVDPRELEDEDAAALRALAEKKRRKGDTVVSKPEGGEDAHVIDLVEILKQRLGAKRAARRRQSKS